MTGQHRPCGKGDGGTATSEGVNNSLRHRCGALVRRTAARCRGRAENSLWHTRLLLVVLAHNRNGQSRLTVYYKTL